MLLNNIYILVSKDHRTVEEGHGWGGGARMGSRGMTWKEGYGWGGGLQGNGAYAR